MTLMELPVLRTTGLRDFATCPRRWQETFLIRGENKRQTREQKIGTAAHLIAESTLLARHVVQDAVLPSEEDLDAAMEAIPNDEIDNLSVYLMKLRDLPIKELLAVEKEFRINVDGIDIPIKGTIDAVYISHEGHLVILDHKTDRSIKPMHYWMQNMQMRIYAWAARQLWPGLSVDFQLGYVNHGMIYTWPTFAEDDDALMVELKRIWRDMQAYEAANQWPEKANLFCGYCPLHDPCGTRKGALVSFQQSLTEVFNPPPLGERLKRIELICKLAEEEHNRIKDEIYALCKDSEDPIIGEDGYSYRVKVGESRKIDPGDALPIIVGDLLTAAPDQLPAKYDALTKVLSVKVTGVDLLRKLGEHKLYEQLSNTVTKVPGARRIEVRPVDKLFASIVEGIES